MAIRLPSLKVQPAGKISRVDAIDLFKFWVLFFMIQGHLFRAYLLPSIRQLHWYQVHEVLHGMVAPGFLFAAGFTAFLAYHNKRDQYVGMNKAFFKRLQRILFVFWMGYFIHLPFLSLRKIISLAGQGKINDFFKVDILQCIGVGLILFTVTAALVKSEKMVVLFSTLFGLLFFLLPNVVCDIRLHYIIDPYFDWRVSLFPLFPWAGFLFAGVVIAYFFTWIEREAFFRFLLVVGIAIFPWFFFKSSAVYFKAELTLAGNLNKIGGVFILLWISNFLLRRFAGGFLNLLKRAGKESLFVYVLHLFIIFNSFLRPGLKNLFENRLNVPEALAVFFGVQLVVFALSLGYNALKEKQYFLWRLLFYSFWTVFLVILLVKPH